MIERLRETFRALYGVHPTVVTFAPGRIEFIGNHTDYNGGPVLGAAVDRGVWVGLAPRQDSIRRLASDYQVGGPRPIQLPPGLPTPRVGDDSWLNYPLGVLAVMPSFGFETPEGFDFLAVSDLPIGAGLSSSAAIELATALALLAANRDSCPPSMLARIGRKAENDFVGVPCGILDQSVSAYGHADRLVYVVCSRLEVRLVALPSDARFWVFNTHTKHALVDGLYAERHRECMYAADSLGVSELAEASEEQLERLKNELPAEVTMRARHVIAESRRVQEVVAELEAGRIEVVGRKLAESHESSRTLFENSTPELDFLVELLGQHPHVLGARLMGGGFGGAVLALTKVEFNHAYADDVTRSYIRRFGSAPDVLQLRSGGGARIILA